MLLQQMHSIATRRPALERLSSYLSNRTMVIKIGDAISRQRQLCCGVPQGSVLGPLLFTTYCMPISAISPNKTLSITCTLTIRSCTRNPHARLRMLSEESGDEVETYIPISLDHTSSKQNRVMEKIVLSKQMNSLTIVNPVHHQYMSHIKM